MKQPAYQVGNTADTVQGATNAAAAVTVAAVASKRHLIRKVVVSYNAVPTAGTVQIATSTNVYFQSDIPGVGPYTFEFEPPIAGAVGAALVATLSAGGAGVKGTVNVLHDSVPG